MTQKDLDGEAQTAAGMFVYEQNQRMAAATSAAEP